MATVAAVAADAAVGEVAVGEVAALADHPRTRPQTETAGVETVKR
jgi:hypothetical protein